MTDFNAWLATPPPPSPYANSKSPGVSKTNPRSSKDYPWLDLQASEWFKVLDHEEDKMAQIREVIAIERQNADQEWVREYRGYGVYYLKDNRTFAARGEAQFVNVTTTIPRSIKARLDAMPWPPR